MRGSESVKLKGMSRLQWSEEHTIHLPEIDAEHRSIHFLAMDLKKSLVQGAPPAEIEIRLRALLAELEDHFAHEERSMREARYAMYSWHKGQHDTLRKRSRNFAERIQAGDPKAGKQLIAFVARWLDDHIAVADNMMGAALRNHQRLHAA